MSLRLDPDLAKVIAALPPMPRSNVNDVSELREVTNTILGTIFGARPAVPGVSETTIHFTSRDGTRLPIYKFTPANTTHDTSKPQPAIIFVHAGGMVSGKVAFFRNVITKYAASTGTIIYAVEYRLAPECPFPGPIHDVYDALEWLHQHAVDEGVDPARIGIWGESAGGGIAAGVVLMARDKSLSPPIAKQVLIYPMLDERTVLGPEHPLNPFLGWTSWYNTLGWNAYLGADRTDISPYASPARATNLSELPRTYIDVGGLDLFRDEDIAYAARLAAANVDVEFHLYAGVPHGWEGVAPDIPVSKRAEQNRIAALSDL
ncbi:putative arylesterase monooxygenase [Echria macrotheca]|uniref:Arylesterase monooxygenase n=1 Tax=Echria macrotheca TaxID=438768 RepID=A0AAJ0BAY1_9PEZI|nr:putative arylesterase monooxygenase [Echria macrotheca]